jgi:fructosamine-3-kinase
VSPDVRGAIESALGAAVSAARPVSGGDINEAFCAELEDGRWVFVKTNARAAASMFPTEALGLSWLAEARVLRIPEVLAVSGGEPGAPAFLVLEWLEPGAPARSFDEVLGQGLAALHAFGAPGFGLDHDNFIGRLAQRNTAHPTRVEFYRSERLERELQRAADHGLACARMREGFRRLFARLEAMVGPPEPPARLHGDLWGGNLHVAPDGSPCLIDPAVYGGHREVDLAMMRLFGGFSECTFDAYAEAAPLAPGHEERVALYQLYPLMVHVNLFGGSYVGSVERVLGSLS